MQILHSINHAFATIVKLKYAIYKSTVIVRSGIAVGTQRHTTAAQHKLQHGKDWQAKECHFIKGMVSSHIAVVAQSHSATAQHKPQYCQDCKAKVCCLHSEIIEITV